MIFNDLLTLLYSLGKDCFKMFKPLKVLQACSFADKISIYRVPVCEIQDSLIFWLWD